jgi:COP9 signalosome complex subunit 1
MITYSACATGRTAIDRLIHIINTCPSIAPAAAAHAARIIPTTRDPNLYGAVQAAYETARAKGTSGELPPVSDVLKVDQAWVDATSSKNVSDRQRLEVELKNYTNNMIKESIRVSFCSLGLDGMAIEREG